MNDMNYMSRPRKHAVTRIARYLRERGHPRLLLFGTLVMTGIVGALASFSMLHTGVYKMSIRYQIAATFGYLAFLISLRAWRDHIIHQPHIAFEIRKIVDEPSTDAAADPDHEEKDSGDQKEPIVGMDLVEAIPVFDDAPIIISVIVILLGLIGMVISTAPMLLAEVLLDGLIMAGIYNRLKKAGTDDLLDTAFRATWLKAIIVVLALLIIGVLFEAISPSARSIGEVVRSIFN